MFKLSNEDGNGKHVGCHEVDVESIMRSDIEQAERKLKERKRLYEEVFDEKWRKKWTGTRLSLAEMIELNEK